MEWLGRYLFLAIGKVEDGKIYQKDDEEYLERILLDIVVGSPGDFHVPRRYYSDCYGCHDRVDVGGFE